MSDAVTSTYRGPFPAFDQEVAQFIAPLGQVTRVWREDLPLSFKLHIPVQ